MVVFEVIGAVGALLASTGVLGVSLAGTAATIVGVSTAWLQTKQHPTLASAYAVASRELQHRCAHHGSDGGGRLGEVRGQRGGRDLARAHALGVITVAIASRYRWAGPHSYTLR